MSIFNNGSAAPTEEKSPWVQPGFIAAAAVIGLLVLLGLILAVTGGSGGNATEGVKAAPAPAVAKTSDANASVCGLAAGSQAIPTRPPAANWVLRGTLAVPTASVGPHTFKGGLPSCFAHSPTGALFANVSIYAAISNFSKHPPANPRAVLRQLIAAGPGRDAAEANAGKGSPGASDSTAGVQVAGFSITRYDADGAVVDLAFRVDRPEASGYFHTTSSMRWENGDWKLVLSQNATPFDATQQIPDLNGYVAWSGT